MKKFLLLGFVLIYVVNVYAQQLGSPTPLQTALNALPAIRIADNNLKFEFGGDAWIARVNGEPFLFGTIETLDTDEGSILILKQTHTWSGAAGKTAGRLASRIPGGSAVSGALDTAGSVLSLAGAIEASGPRIILEHKAGPPVSLTPVTGARAAQMGIGPEASALSPPVELDSSQALKNYLASLKPNTSYNPAQVTMLNISNLMDLGTIIKTSRKYINLDLSKCTSLKNIQVEVFTRCVYLTGITLPNHFTVICVLNTLPKMEDRVLINE